MQQLLSASRISAIVDLMLLIFPNEKLESFKNKIVISPEININNSIFATLILNFLTECKVNDAVITDQNLKAAFFKELEETDAEGICLFDHVLESLAFNFDSSALLILRAQILGYKNLTDKLNVFLEKYVASIVELGRFDKIQGFILLFDDLITLLMKHQECLILYQNEYITIGKLVELNKCKLLENDGIINGILAEIPRLRFINIQATQRNGSVGNETAIAQLFTRCDKLLDQNYIVRSRLFMHEDFDIWLLLDYLENDKNNNRRMKLFDKLLAVDVIKFNNNACEHLSSVRNANMEQILVTIIRRYIAKSTDLCDAHKDQLLFPLINLLLNDKDLYKETPDIKLKNRLIIEELIKLMSNVNIKSENYGSILHVLISNYGGTTQKIEMDTRLINLLLHKRIDCINILDRDNRSALEVAAFSAKEVFEAILFPLREVNNVLNELIFKLLQDRCDNYRSLFKKLGGTVGWDNFALLNNNISFWDNLTPYYIKEVQIFFDMLVCRANHMFINKGDLNALTPVINKLKANVGNFDVWMVKILANLIPLSRNSILSDRIIVTVRHKIYEYLAQDEVLCSKMSLSFTSASIDVNSILGNQLCVEKKAFNLAVEYNNVPFILMVLKMIMFYQDRRRSRNPSETNLEEKEMLRDAIIELINKKVNIRPIIAYLDPLVGLYAHMPVMLQSFEARLLVTIYSLVPALAESNTQWLIRRVAEYVPWNLLSYNAIQLHNQPTIGEPSSTRRPLLS